MRVVTESGEVEVTWWIEVKSRVLHLAIDRYENGVLADVPDSVQVDTIDQLEEALRGIGAHDPAEPAAQLWSVRPS